MNNIETIIKELPDGGGIFIYNGNDSQTEDIAVADLKALVTELTANRAALAIATETLQAGGYRTALEAIDDILGTEELCNKT